MLFLIFDICLIDPEQSEFPRQQYVLIDIRSLQDSKVNGGGLIPRALQMDPEFLDNEDGLLAWMDHLDGTKGINLCLIDIPPGQESAFSLWRRLLLGEGDGLTSSSSQFSSKRSKIDTSFFRDESSRYLQLENEMIQEESHRMASQLAKILQQHHFPYVSVLEGGFPALVQQLHHSRGMVEPIVDNHQSELWERYLRDTGRHKYSCKYVSWKNWKDKRQTDSVKDADERSHDDNELELLPELTELDRLQIAYATATRLNHVHMASVLLERIQDQRKRAEGHVTSPLIQDRQ